MMQTPIEQEFFDRIGLEVEGLGYDVYPTLPPLETAYPFVVIGENHITRKLTSTRLLGKAYATLHVWGKLDQRKTVSKAMEDIASSLVELQLETRRLKQNANGTSYRIMGDDSTDSQLWHGVMHLEYFIL